MEYDFFFMLFFIILMLFAITSALKVFYPVDLDSNLVLYMIIFTIMLIVVNLMKNTFSMRYTRFSDETKVEILVSVKAFAMIYFSMRFMTAKALVDFDLEKGHTDVLNRIN